MSQKTSQLHSLVLFPLMFCCLTSCSDFVDDKSAPSSPTPAGHVEPQKSDMASFPVTTPNDSSGKTPPETPKSDVPEPKRTTEPEESEEARNKRWCQEERDWTLEMHLIDVGAYRLYQTRDFAPVFKEPGQRQSGIEGWYACKHALELNGFIPPEAVLPIES